MNMSDDDDNLNNDDNSGGADAMSDTGKAGLAGANSNAGRWTDEEHARFLEALQIFGKNWNKVHRHVGTRTSA